MVVRGSSCALEYGLADAPHTKQAADLIIMSGALGPMLKIPWFANESQEADWWYDNRHLLAEEFDRAAATRSLRIGFRGPAVSLRLRFDDYWKSKDLAETHKVHHAIYLEELLHDVLKEADTLRYRPLFSKSEE